MPSLWFEIQWKDKITITWTHEAVFQVWYYITAQKAMQIVLRLVDFSLLVEGYNLRKQTPYFVTGPQLFSQIKVIL